jgi:hypothetical protein
MNTCGIVLKKGMTVVLCALTVAVGGTALAGVAQEATLWVGDYNAVQKISGQPDQVSIWKVTSTGAFLSCVAHVANKAGGSDWMFDGKQWNRLAVPQTGDCNGATVPARSARETLVPRADGSLSEGVASTVDCNGVTVDMSQPLTLTPLEP